MRTYNNTKHSNRKTSHPTRIFSTQVGNWRLFQQKVVQHRQWEYLVNNSSTKEQLDAAITTIWDDLEAINNSSHPLILPKIKNVPRWSPKLNALRKQVNALKCRVIRCENPVVRVICGTRFKELKTNTKQKSL